MKRTAPFLSVLLLALPAACQSAGEAEWVSPIAFDTATVVLSDGSRSATLVVEIAETEAQRQFGLSRRPSLDENSGMLFLFDGPRSEEQGFWMWQTRVPLDIAYIDQEGVVRAVVAMDPCEGTYANACPVYEAGVPYASALETNQGWFQRNGFGVGTSVRVER